MRILYAEDERDLNDLVTRRLVAEGYGVDSCLDGQQAWDYLQTADYDAAILDIMMPHLDGLSVLKKLRAAGKTTPVLLLTARDAIADRVAGLDSGANDYLVKFRYIWLYKVRAKPVTENYATKEGKSITRQTGEVEWTAIRRTHDNQYQAVADEGENGFTAEKGATFLESVYEPVFTSSP